MAAMQSLSIKQEVPRNFRGRFETWKTRGLSTRAATILAMSGCGTVADVTSLGRSWFAGQRNVGATTLAELSTLAGWPPEQGTAVDAIAAALNLSIHNPAEAREAAIDACVALRRSGFAIVTRGGATR